MVTDFWWHQGVDKTGNTVGNTVGLASVGAVIGAIAGGGVGLRLGPGLEGWLGWGCLRLRAGVRRRYRRRRL